MNIIPLLILCSLSLGLLFLMVFIWWVKSGQGEDLVTPGMRVLFDDAPIAGTDNTSSDNTNTEPQTESKN